MRSSPAVSHDAASPNRGESYSRLVARYFWRSRLNRLALYVVLVLCGLALVADFLAADKPIFASLNGESHWLPNLVDTPALRMLDNQRLMRRMGTERLGGSPARSVRLQHP